MIKPRSDYDSSFSILYDILLKMDGEGTNGNNEGNGCSCVCDNTEMVGTLKQIKDLLENKEFVTEVVREIEVEKPIVTEKSVIVEKPVIVEQEKVKEVTVEKPVIVEKTVVKEIEKQVVVEKPVIVEKQVVVEKPVYKEVEKKIIVEKPVIIEKEKVIREIVTNQCTCNNKPVSAQTNTCTCNHNKPCNCHHNNNNTKPDDNKKQCNNNNKHVPQEYIEVKPNRTDEYIHSVVCKRILIKNPLYRFREKTSNVSKKNKVIRYNNPHNSKDNKLVVKHCG